MKAPDTTTHPKVTSAHLQCLAYVYVRQSSMKQVEHNRESQRNQYRLVERAQSLGWSANRTRVIDSDLGQSGQSSEHRNGFNDLLAEVTLGHVGIILSYEVSRLARNNSDWYRLLDLAAVFGTLIADVDGVYDPRGYNDRLLLGLKGAMSEAELHILRSRMDAGRLSQVHRGEFIQNLPTGLVRLENGQVVKDPDMQIQEVMHMVFSQFAELGSCGKVMRYFRDHNILLPRRQVAGLFAGELLWKPALNSALLEMLKNPAYAGAFAYGRKQGDLSKMKPGRRAMGRVRFPMDAWIHLQQNVYPAYINWEQYMLNQERLRQNGVRYQEHGMEAQGTPREGAALLQGIAICGMCGHHMVVAYKPTARYYCDALARHMGGKHCISVDGVSVDEVITQAFFAAIQPAQLNVLQEVLHRQHEERTQLERHWQQKLSRAQYEARLADRQYNAVDPDNRLVASTLERQWEDKLQKLREVQEEHERFLHASALPELTREMSQQFEQISEHLPALWASGKVSYVQKKELLRCLISRVILDRIAAETIEVRIVWISGHCTIENARVQRVFRTRDLSNYAAMVERVQQLCQQGLNDEQMAAQLTSEGFAGARRGNVPMQTVREIRLTRGWYLLKHEKRMYDRIDGRWTVRGLSKHIGLTTNYVLKCINDGTIPAEYVSRDATADIYLITDLPAAIESVRQRYIKNGRHPKVRRQSDE